MTPEEFFALEARRPFVWGVNDCAKTANRWCMVRTGRSPIKSSDQDYFSKGEADELLQTAAMPIRVARAMRAAGFKRVAAPEPGDLAIVRLADRYACAVRGERVWMFRDENGLCGAGDHARVVAAWRVG